MRLMNISKTWGDGGTEEKPQLCLEAKREGMAEESYLEASRDDSTDSTRVQVPRRTDNGHGEDARYGTEIQIRQSLCRLRKAGEDEHICRKED